MTLLELKKAAQELSLVDKRELKSFLNTIVPEGNLEISKVLQKELDRIEEGLKSSKIGTRPYSEIRADIRSKHGI